MPMFKKSMLVLLAVVPPIEPFSYVIGYASQEGEDKETAKEESP